MKALVLLMMGWGLQAQADVSAAATIRGYQYDACGNWVFSNPAFPGYPGYVCALRPQGVFVASAVSVKDAVQELEDRIVKLEARLQNLEAAAAQK